MKKSNNPLRGLIKFGNTKVDDCTAVFNMSPATKCRSKELGFCTMGDDCYALLPEIDFRSHVVLPYRMRQMNYWLNCTAEQFAENFLDIAKRRKKAVCTHLRMSEAGDFHGQACVDKLAKIAGILKQHGIITYVYTCAHDLDFSQRDDLVIVGSGKKYDSQFKVSPNHIEAYRKAKARGENAYLCGSGCGGKCDACGRVGAIIYARLLPKTRNYLKAKKKVA